MEYPHEIDTDSDHRVAHCREILGDDAADLTDEELESVRAHADALARVIIDLFVQQHAIRSGRS